MDGFGIATRIRRNEDEAIPALFRSRNGHRNVERQRCPPLGPAYGRASELGSSHGR